MGLQRIVAGSPSMPLRGGRAAAAPSRARQEPPAPRAAAQRVEAAGPAATLRTWRDRCAHVWPALIGEVCLGVQRVAFILFLRPALIVGV